MRYVLLLLMFALLAGLGCSRRAERSPAPDGDDELVFADSTPSGIRFCIAGRPASAAEVRRIRRRDVDSMTVVKSELPASHPTERARACDIDLFLTRGGSRRAR